jgi:urease accessory protein
MGVGATLGDGRHEVSPEQRLGSLFSLLQLSDSAFPSGRFTLSYGLEALVQHGVLGTPSCPSVLDDLLTGQVLHAVAPSDGVALACAHRAVTSRGALDMAEVARVDERLTAAKLAREGRDASTRTGRALLDTAVATFEAAPLRQYAAAVRAGSVPGNHAVVLGLLSALVGVPRTDAVAGELFAFCASWVAAAVRLAVTDHRTAQALLHRARGVAVRAAPVAAEQGIEHIWSCTPQLDAMAMRHEEAELRLFAS